MTYVNFVTPLCEGGYIEKNIYSPKSINQDWTFVDVKFFKNKNVQKIFFFRIYSLVIICLLVKV